MLFIKQPLEFTLSLLWSPCSPRSLPHRNPHLRAGQHPCRLLSRILFLVFWVSFCAVGLFGENADRVEQRNALERRGTHAASIAMTVVDPRGSPVEADITLLGHRGGWPGFLYVVASTSTDTHGRAEIHDLDCPDTLSVLVDPPERLRRFHAPVRFASNGKVDFGTLTLRHNSVVTGNVLEIDVSGTRTEVDSGWVALRKASVAGHEGSYELEELNDGRFRFDELDGQPVEIVFSRQVRNGRPSGPDVYRAPFRINSERPVRQVTLMIDHRTEGGVTLSVSEQESPAQDKQPRHRLEGRLLLPGGEPIRGLPVWTGVGKLPISTITDLKGRFFFETKSLSEDGLLVLTPAGPLTIAFNRKSVDDDELPAPRYLVDPNKPFEIELSVLKHLDVKVEGVLSNEVSYSWIWVDNDWIPLDRDLVDLILTEPQGQLMLRARTPGHFARFALYPPKQSALRFDFEKDIPHRLQVVSNGKPIAGAKVEIVETSGLFPATGIFDAPGQNILLDRVETDTEGRVSLAGDPQAAYVAYVYAAGYDPARIRWRAGVEARLDLKERNIGVRFTGLQSGELLQVKPAGRDALIGGWYVGDAEAVATSLSPGVYDVSVTSSEGAVVRGTTFTATKSIVVDLTVDRRPRVVLHLPPLPAVPERYRKTLSPGPDDAVPRDRWIALATRKTPPSGTVGALAQTSSGYWSSDEPPVQAESPDDLTRILRLSGTGRWLVHLSAEHDSLDSSLFTEVDLAPAENLELEVPPLDSGLEGSMTFKGDLAYSHHGVAGPRLMLISMLGNKHGWNIVCSIPPRLAEKGPNHHLFSLKRLPAGQYRIAHHLGERPGWGGGEVTLDSGQSTKIARLGAAESTPLTVEVFNADGRPARDLLLRVRDRMHERWAAFCEIPTSGVFASRPIPPPPEARLLGEAVTLPSIRDGWLELVLEDEAGSTRHYLRKVEPRRKLHLHVGN